MKRAFLYSIASLVLMTSSGRVHAQQDFDDVVVTAHPVAGQVYYLEGRGGNIGLFVGDDGVFLIDDQFAPLTDKIVAAIREISDGPIRFLVNTHLHPDHTGGNENFGKMGTLIFGHDNVRKQMILGNLPQEPPLVTFGEDMTFHINGETVYVFKTPNAHTNGDVYILFEESNVVHTGDIYRTTTYPYIDTGNGGSFLGLIKALDLLVEISNAETKIIPGHGVISNVAEVRAWRDMLLVIRDRIQTAIDEGKTLEQAQAAGLTAEFDERWAASGRIGSPATMIEAAYQDMAR